MDSSLNPLTVRVAHASDRTPMTEVTLPQSATVADLVAAVRNCADLAAVEPSAHRRTIARLLLPTPPPLPLAEIAPADFEWATTLLTAVGVVDGGTVYAHVCDTAADVALANDRYTADTINAAAKAASEATRRLAGAILADLGTVSREEAAARAVIAEEAKAAEVEAYSDGLVSLHQSSIIDRLAVRRADLMPLDAVSDGGEEEENGGPNFGGNGNGDHYFGIHGDEGPLTCSRPLAITNNSNEPRWLPLPNVRVRAGQFCAVEMSVAVVPAPVAVAAPPGVTPAEMAARAAAAAHRSLSGLAVEYASAPKPKNANDGVNANGGGGVAADAAIVAAATTAKTRAVLLGRCVHTAGGDPVAPHRKAQPAMYGNIPFNAGQFASNFAYTVTTTTVSPAPPTPTPEGGDGEGAPLAGDAAEAADANVGATAVASPAGAGQQKDEEDEVKGQVRQTRFVEDVEVSIDVKHAEPGASRRLSLVVDRTAVRSAPIVKAFCGREARNGTYTRIYSGPVAPSAALAAGNRRGHSSSAPSLSSSAASFLRGGSSAARSCSGRGNAKAAKIDDDGAFSFSVCVAPMTTVRVEHVLFAHEAAIPDGFRE